MKHITYEPPIERTVRRSVRTTSLQRQNNINAYQRMGVDPDNVIVTTVRSKVAGLPQRLAKQRWMALHPHLRRSLNAPRGSWGSSLARDTTDAWEGDFSVTNVLSAVPALARLAPPQLSVLLAVLPAVLDLLETIAASSKGDPFKERVLLDYYGMDHDAYDRTRQFFLKKIGGMLKKGLKSVGKIAAPLLKGIPFVGGLASGVLGTVTKAIGGSGKSKKRTAAPAAAPQEEQESSGFQTEGLLSEVGEYAKELITRRLPPGVGKITTAITYPVRMQRLIEDYNSVAAANGLPKAEIVLAACLEYRLNKSGSPTGPGYNLLETNGFSSPSTDCCRDESQLVAFTRGDERYPPKGEFFSSPWLTARLDDLPSGVYGMIHTGRKPMEMTINRKIEKPRLMLSYAHEGVHAMDKLYKLGLSHDQVHSTADFLLTNVLPGLNALDTAVGYSDESDNTPSHILRA